MVRIADALKRQRLTPTQAVHLVEVIAEAMTHAHHQGIVHRDLKPANILLVNANAEPAMWIPKVVDFGLTRLMAAGGSLTVTGDVVGTPQYMSPEQVQGRVRAISPASDVYALGAMLYELLTGEAPFVFGERTNLFDRINHDVPCAPSTKVSGVTKELDALCLKCLEKSPAKRFAEASLLVKELRAYRLRIQ